MERSLERLAAAAAALFALCAVTVALLTGWTGRETVGGLLPFHLIGLGISAFTWMRASLQRRAEEERRDHAVTPDLEPADTRLFAETEEGEPFSAARSERLFERYAVAAAAPALAFVEGFFAVWRFRRLSAFPFSREAGGLLAVAILVTWSFFLFLLGRYLLAFSKTRGRQVIRPVGSFLGFLSLLHLLAVVFLLAAHYGMAHADQIGTTLFAGLLAVLALEMLLLTIGEFYRPQPPAAGIPLPYETRIGRLLADPTRLAHGAGRALDYQFGFQVSETWFFRFLERALIPLLCLQVLLLYSLSSVVVLGPEEEAIVERFGQPPLETSDKGGRHLLPGIHAKWPWPFETVRRVPVRRLQSFTVGFEEQDGKPGRRILWTRPHFVREDLFLVASRNDLPKTNDQEAAVPVNFLSYAIRVEYRVTNLLHFLYGHANPILALENIAHRNLTRESASRGLFDVLGAGYSDVSQTIHRLIQAEADRLGLGVEITNVLFQGVHPPVTVAPNFEEVVGAMEEREARILEAQAYRNKVLPLAIAEAQQRIYEAKSYRTRRTAVSEAESNQFLSRRKGYRVSPRVFRSRHRLESLRKAIADARLFLIVTEPDSEVIQINLEERTPASLLDVSPAGKE